MKSLFKTFKVVAVVVVIVTYARVNPLDSNNDVDVAAAADFRTHSRPLFTRPRAGGHPALSTRTHERARRLLFPNATANERQQWLGPFTKTDLRWGLVPFFSFHFFITPDSHLIPTVYAIITRLTVTPTVGIITVYSICTHDRVCPIIYISI